MDLKLSAFGLALAGALTLGSCASTDPAPSDSPPQQSSSSSSSAAGKTDKTPAQESTQKPSVEQPVAKLSVPDAMSKEPTAVTTIAVQAPEAAAKEPVRAAPAQPTGPEAAVKPAAPQSAAKPVAAVQTGPSEFGEPLIINGKRVNDNEIKRYLIYGPCRLVLEMYRIGLIVDDELSRHAQAKGNAAIEPQVKGLAAKAASAAVEGQTFATPEEKQKAYDAAYATAHAEAQKSPELLKTRQDVAAAEFKRLKEVSQPSEAEFQAELKTTYDEFRKNYPHLELDAEVCRAFRSVDWFKRNLRQTMLFDRVFYPEDPADWPDSTVESVRADSGEALLDDAVNSFKMRKEHSDKTGEPMRKEDSIYTNMMRQIVRDALYRTIDFKTSFDGLADDLVLTADKDGDGKLEMTVTTAEVWDIVKDTVSQDEIDQAKQWFVTSMATADRLKSEGFLLDDAGRAAAIADLSKQFAGTYINLEILATQTCSFPSVESFKEYYCLSEGFKKAIEPSLAPGPDGEVAKPLRDHLDHANKVMGLGQVDVEVMLISAFDILRFKWKPDGWNWAKQRATEIKAKIDANAAAYEAQRAAAAKATEDNVEFKPATMVEEPYVYWTNQMNDHSEYWDPPPPDKTGRKAEVGMKNRGRFGLRYRNDLQPYVGETQFTQWLTGRSITDHVFFDGEAGVVEGPFKGPLGYYLTRVAKRTPPTFPLNLSEPKKVDLLKQDYQRVAFVGYAKEAVAKASVKGFAGL